MPTLDREAKRAANRVQMDKRRKIIDAAKDVPCADCGIKYPPAVMDLDHIAGDGMSKRKGSFTRFAMSCGIERLKQEIAKCEVRCANCHRMRHFCPVIA